MNNNIDDAALFDGLKEGDDFSFKMNDRGREYDVPLKVAVLKVHGTEQIVKAFYRPGTNDRDVLQACIPNDEYFFSKLCVAPTPEKGRWAIDVGAHIGGASLALIARGYKVTAVEPVPENAAILRMNIMLNGCEVWCRVIEFPAGAGDGKPVMVEWGQQLQGATEGTKAHGFIGVTREQDGTTFERHTEQCKVMATIGLRALLSPNSQAGLQRCDLLKLDCEGAELPLLASAKPEELRHVEIIVGEIHGAMTHVGIHAMCGGDSEFVDVSHEFWKQPETEHFCLLNGHTSPVDV